jgi:molecular chaperone GrpE
MTDHEDAPETAAAEADPTQEAAEGSNPEGQGEVGSAPAPEERIAQLEAEVNDLTDQLLRKSADFDNFRKRKMREQEEFAAYANKELLLDIVPIIDDFERAIKSSEDAKDFEAFHNGVAMIERQLVSILERKWKLKRFDSEGEEFDPQRHEAMMSEERSDHTQSMVLEDYQKGYLLGERVLRPAKVKVSVPAADAGTSENDEQKEE